MRVWAISDLHLTDETRAAFPKRLAEVGVPDADVCVVAGDVNDDGRAAVAVSLLDRTIGRHMPVVYVPGNHEPYGSVLDASDRAARDAAKAADNVHLLDRGSVILDGVRFLGCRLWTDWNLLGERLKPSAQAASVGMIPDFTKVRMPSVAGMSPRYMTPRDQERLHAVDLGWLREELAAEFDGPTVVVTHHCHSRKSVSMQWAAHPATPGYASDLDGLMLETQPGLWIHGHTHTAFEYEIGGTKVVCNPHGMRRGALLTDDRMRPSTAVTRHGRYAVPFKVHRVVEVPSPTYAASRSYAR